MEMDKLVTLLDLCPSNSSHSTNLRLLCQVAFLSLKGAAMDSCMNRYANLCKLKVEMSMHHAYDKSWKTMGDISSMIHGYSWGFKQLFWGFNQNFSRVLKIGFSKGRFANCIISFHCSDFAGGAWGKLFLGNNGNKTLVFILVFNCPFSQSSEHTSSNTLDFPTVYI